MSRHPITQIAFDWLTCPRCGALAGEWCRTRSGRRAAYLHTERTEPTRRAFLAGHESAEADERSRRLRVVGGGAS